MALPCYAAVVLWSRQHRRGGGQVSAAVLSDDSVRFSPNASSLARSSVGCFFLLSFSLGLALLPLRFSKLQEGGSLPSSLQISRWKVSTAFRRSFLRI